MAEGDGWKTVAEGCTGSWCAAPFRDGDVVLDVGAHVGLVSLYLAKRWPFLRIHAFEPHPVNHPNCAENLRLNGVGNVRLERRAVTADGRAIELRCLPWPRIALDSSLLKDCGSCSAPNGIREGDPPWPSR